MFAEKTGKIILVCLVIALAGAGFLAGYRGASCLWGPKAVALAVDESLDTDADGLADLLEITVHHTDPTRPDTDGDGYADGLEVANGYSPLHGESRRMVDVDTDRDYLNDDWEVKAGTDLTDPDSDGDLYLDGTEVAAAYDPLDPNPVRVSKRIDVDLKTQTLSYYLDEKLVESFPISSGLPGTPSPVGNFSVLDKVPVKHYGGPGFDFPNTKWNLLFHRSGSGTGYYVHGAYWHDNWGHPMSHGCINVPYERMERLYWWAQHGTPVVIR